MEMVPLENCDVLKALRGCGGRKKERKKEGRKEGRKEEKPIEEG